MSEDKKEKYEFRQIEADDLEYFTEVIAKLDANDISECFKNNDSMEAVGIKLGLVVCKNYKRAKKDIYSLLAKLSSLSEDKIAHMPLPDYVEMIAALFKEPGIVDSFKAASSFAE